MSNKSLSGRWLFMILLLAPFGFAIFFWDVSSQMLLDEKKTQADDSSKLMAPQTIVDNTELIQFNLEGAPAHWLSSNQLLSDAQGLIHISEPVINIDPSQESNWDARSDKGVYDQQAEFLHLKGNVILIKREEESPPITMTTDALDYFPDLGFAESDTPVIIETPGHRIESSGISVDFKASIYKLKSDVRSSHDPI